MGRRCKERIAVVVVLWLCSSYFSQTAPPRSSLFKVPPSTRFFLYKVLPLQGAPSTEYPLYKVPPLQCAPSTRSSLFKVLPLQGPPSTRFSLFKVPSLQGTSSIKYPHYKVPPLQGPLSTRFPPLISLSLPHHPPCCPLCSSSRLFQASHS